MASALEELVHGLEGHIDRVARLGGPANAAAQSAAHEARAHVSGIRSRLHALSAGGGADGEGSGSFGGGLSSAGTVTAEVTNIVSLSQDARLLSVQQHALLGELVTAAAARDAAATSTTAAPRAEVQRSTSSTRGARSSGVTVSSENYRPSPGRRVVVGERTKPEAAAYVPAVSPDPRDSWDAELRADIVPSHDDEPDWEF